MAKHNENVQVACVYVTADSDEKIEQTWTMICNTVDNAPADLELGTFGPSREWNYMGHRWRLAWHRLHEVYLALRYAS